MTLSLRTLYAIPTHIGELCPLRYDYCKESINGGTLHMKSRSLSLLVTLLLLIVLAGVFVITRLDTTRPPQSQLSNEPIPYIYYYSDLEHAFVIERADGTDSRLLAQGVMPENHDTIDSVHWSPSGEYLAWRSHRHNGPGSFSVSGWVVSSNGTYVSDLLNDANNVIHMEWSPDEDILAVIFYDEYYGHNETVRLIDVPENRIVAEISSYSILESLSIYSHPDIWATDGSSVYFTMSNPGVSVLTRLYFDGTSEHWLGSERYPIYSSRERIMQRDYEYRSDGRYHNWTITDLTTGEVHLYDSFYEDDAPDDFYIFWNPTGEYALIYENTCEFTTHRRCQRSGLALFDLQSDERYTLENVDSIALDINRRTVEQPWSPDGTVLMLQDETDQLYMLDATTREMFSIETSGIVLWKWLGERDVLMLTYDDEDIPSPHAFRYSWANHTTQELEDISSNLVPLWDYFDVSPDGAFIGHYGTFEIHIQNLDTGENYQYPISSALTYRDYPRAMGYKWSNDSQWFFSESGFNALMIHHINSDYGRELTQCYDVHTCVGFVPDVVLSNLRHGEPTSVSPVPMNTLLHDYSVYGVIWNDDGTKIASYSVDHSRENDDLISIWNMTGTHPVLENTFVADLNCEHQFTSCPILLENDDTFSEITQSAEYEVLITDDDEPIAFLIDTQTQQHISNNPLLDFPTWRLHEIVYNANNNLLVEYRLYSRGKIWDVETGELLSELNWTGNMAQFNPDGTRLAVASSHLVSIWDMTPYIEQVNDN